MRNWTSHPAFRIAQFLFYYRLVGVALFELTDERLMLLLFPNTFEYFFIAYEIARLRYQPSRFSARFWLLVAAGIWIFVKLPQEYWIHIAKLDFTDTVSDYPAFGVAVVAALVVAALVLVFVVSRGSRLPTGGGGSSRPAAGVARRQHARYARRLESGRALRGGAGAGVRCWRCCAPSSPRSCRRSTPPASRSPSASRRSCSPTPPSASQLRGAVASVSSRRPPLCRPAATNLALVYVANALLGERRDFDLGYGLFFAFLITTIIWLYDAFRPVYDLRFAGAASES